MSVQESTPENDVRMSTLRAVKTLHSLTGQDTATCLQMIAKGHSDVHIRKEAEEVLACFF